MTTSAEITYDPVELANEIGQPLRGRRILEPHYELIRILRGRGWTYEEIKKTLGNKLNLRVSCSAISNFCKLRQIATINTLNNIKQAKHVREVRNKIKEANDA